jgi:OmpA-OmpF porin, OOP family
LPYCITIGKTSFLNIIKNKKMKNFYSFLLGLFIVSTAAAQNVVFHDTFDDDKNNWTTTKDDYASYIKKGELIIENKSTNGAKWHLYKLGINSDEVDFDIEASIKVLSASKDTDTYGLVWSGYNDNSYYNVVRLTPDKQVQLYQYQKDKFDYYRPWSKEKYINGYKKTNRIKVVKRANITRVYINDNLVHQTGENSYYGNKIGFILDTKMTIAIEEVKVTEFPKKIRVVDSYNPSLKIEKLPEIISSKEYEETNPVVSADGTILYVDRKYCDLNIGSADKDDIWYSIKDVNGNWTPLKNIGRPLNNEGHNFVISSSPDNNTLLVGNTYKPDGSVKSSGVSISNRTIDGWEIPKEMVIKNYENKSKFVAYFLTSDNKHLLMSLERSEGYGLKDLYVSFRENENTWSTPKNLGNVINTFDEEVNPFLASDGKTLYFASRGHEGYGGYDLFVSKRLDDTWTNWSIPENLGNVINTPGTELSIFLAAKGDKAYISRSKDIWEVTNTVKQDPVVLVKGKVYDAKTKQVLSAPIVYNNLKTNKELGTAISDPKTGSYSIVLPYGNLYSFMAEKSGYYAVTENVDVTNLTEYKEINVDLYLNPIEKGQTIRLNNIFFESGKFDLLSESFAELDKLFNILKENKKLQIEIAGHTDAVGSDSSNMTLSNNRANSVMNYLIAKGIDKSRLSAKGYGETKFIATNDTEEGKQLNRRVEFSILDL